MCLRAAIKMISIILKKGCKKQSQSQSLLVLDCGRNFVCHTFAMVAILGHIIELKITFKYKLELLVAGSGKNM